MTQDVNILAESPVALVGGIPAAVLSHLAERVRPHGLFLAVLRPDGTVAYYDPEAGLFFHRYVLPLLQYGNVTGATVQHRTAQATPQTPLAVWNDLPGVIMAAFPNIDRRQVAGVVILAGKTAGFGSGEDVARICGRLEIDGQWLAQTARALPIYSEEVIERHGRLLAVMLRDQIRLTSIEGEVDSLSKQLSTTYEELSLIYQISSGMRINRHADDFFKQACLDVLEVMDVRGMGVAVSGDEAPRQEPALYGHLSLPPGALGRLVQDLLPILTERKGPLLINDLSQDKTFAWLGEHAHQLMAVPLQRQDVVLGCFFGLDKTCGDFDSQDSKLLTSIANESAIYLENAMLYEDVHGLMMGLLHSLTSAVDAKDAYTCGHSERVAILSRQLAFTAGLTEAQAERVYMAGLLHDVGKIGVPESVLQKAGRLTVEEFDQMKKHPEIGGRILRNIKQISDLIPGVLYHHERYDGQGYPAKLAGLDIPIMGRIICLADCFDAMTSNRTYRKALPLEVALTEIRRCSGTQFDPTLADAFLKIGAETLRELLAAHQAQARPCDPDAAPVAPIALSV